MRVMQMHIIKTWNAHNLQYFGSGFVWGSSGRFAWSIAYSCAFMRLGKVLWQPAVNKHNREIYSCMIRNSIVWCQQYRNRHSLCLMHNLTGIYPLGLPKFLCMSNIFLVSRNLYRDGEIAGGKMVSTVEKNCKSIIWNPSTSFASFCPCKFWWDPCMFSMCQKISRPSILTPTDPWQCFWYWWHTLSKVPETKYPIMA